MSMVDRIIEHYNFESDTESHVNGEELSDLSDEFEDDGDDTLEGSSSQISSSLSHISFSKDYSTSINHPSSTLAIDDIPYDRDLKWINVPTNARQKPSPVLFNPNPTHTQPQQQINTQNRLFKQVNEIARSNYHELKELDEHYRKLDERKKFADEKFNNNNNNTNYHKTSSYVENRKNRAGRSLKDDRGRGGGGSGGAIGGRWGRNRDEREFYETQFIEESEVSVPEVHHFPPPSLPGDRRFGSGGSRAGFQPFESGRDYQNGMHPLHHQHNHRNPVQHRKQGGRFPDSRAAYNGSNKFTKNLSVQQHQHDDQVRQIRNEDHPQYPQQHALRDYYDHSADFETDYQPANSYSPAPVEDFHNYAYQSPLAGYTANHYKSTTPLQMQQSSPSVQPDSVYSMSVSTSNSTTPLGLNPLAQEFVPSFMLR